MAAGESGRLESSRQHLRAALEPAAFADACGVVASFHAVVKVADATGIVMEAAKVQRTADFLPMLAFE